MELLGRIMVSHFKIETEANIDAAAESPGYGGVHAEDVASRLRSAFIPSCGNTYQTAATPRIPVGDTPGVNYVNRWRDRIGFSAGHRNCACNAQADRNFHDVVVDAPEGASGIDPARFSGTQYEYEHSRNHFNRG